MRTVLASAVLQELQGVHTHDKGAEAYIAPGASSEIAPLLKYLTPIFQIALTGL